MVASSLYCCCAVRRCNCIIELQLLANDSSLLMLKGANLRGEVYGGSVLGEIGFGSIVFGRSWW